MKIQYFLVLFFITFLFSCSRINHSNVERMAMINTASKFLNALKSNDTLKAKSMLFFGLLKSNDEIFSFNVNSASRILNKYGIPADNKITLDSSLQNVPTLIAVTFPIFNAKTTEDSLQKAIIKVFVSKINGKYEVIFFDNDFMGKRRTIEP